MLHSVTLSSGALTPSFSPEVLSYTVDVASTETSISLTPTTMDLDTTITVNGMVVMAGLASPQVALSIGDNFITVVIARSDSMSSTYVVNVRRAASVPPSLSSLSASVGTLSPVFSPGVFSYSETVGFATSALSLTPSTSEPSNTITVNGMVVSSGASSSSIPLATGDNIISVLVTALDGSTQGYSVTVTRAAAVPPALSGLSLSAGVLVPGFSADTLSYTVDVSSAVSTISVTPDTLAAGATLSINGTGALFGLPYAMNLVTGDNPMTLVLTGADTSAQTYAVNVRRAVSIPPSLSALSVSAGAMSPVFGATTFSYSVSVASNVSVTTVTPTSPGNTITVNGQSVVSGVASQNIALATGDNIITVALTAPDTSTQRYSVTVNRAVAVPPPLSGVSVSQGALSPAFSANTLSYLVSVASNISSIAITPSTAVPGASLTVNGVVVASGNASQAINLVTGDNTITIVNTAPDTVTQTYTVTVNRAVSVPPALSALSLSSGVLSPVFSPSTLSYTASVGYAVSNVTVTPTSTGNTITVNGSSVASGASSNPIALSVGSNAVTIVVTAPDTSTQSYTIDITRALAVPPVLSNLTVSSGSLVPVFASGTLSYTVDVPYTTTSMTVTPFSTTTSITVNGAAVSSGSASQAINLNVGDNAVTVFLTAPDTSTATYSLNVRRAVSLPPRLSGLSPSVGALSPVFSAGTFSYGLSVSSTTSAMTVTPSTGDPSATITVNGSAVTSANASQSIPLATGDNTVTITVTAPDSSTQNYVVTVNRAAVPSLSVLSPSTGSALSPAFNGATLNYTMSVSNATTAMTFTPTLGAGASISINGSVVTSGSPSQAINLNVGSNAVNIAVTDAFSTTVTYAITVTRNATPSLSTLVPSVGALSPGFASGTLSYTMTVTNPTTTMTFTPTLGAGASITVNGTSVASGNASQTINLSVGANVVTVIATDSFATTTSYTVTVTRENCVLKSQSLQIASDQNDGEIERTLGFTPQGESGPPSPALYLGYWSGSVTWGYHRFQLQEAIPATATITQAYINFWGLNSSIWGVTPPYVAARMYLMIYAENRPNALAVNAPDQAPLLGYKTSTANDVPITTAKAYWPGGSTLGTPPLVWNVGAYNQTPSLAPLISELVTNHSGLSVNNYVQFWTGNHLALAGENSEVGTEDYSCATVFPATCPVRHPTQLFIEWQECN